MAQVEKKEKEYAQQRKVMFKWLTVWSEASKETDLVRLNNYEERLRLAFCWSDRTDHVDSRQQRDIMILNSMKLTSHGYTRKKRGDEEKI